MDAGNVCIEAIYLIDVSLPILCFMVILYKDTNEIL